jgi:hypothetical protein
MMIEYGPWLPDQPAFQNSCVKAMNVIPLERGYGPFRGPRVVSDALPASPVGAFSFRRVDGVRETFAGTETGLYRLNGTTWDDVTPSGGVSNSTFWRFTQFGTRLIATNGIDNPQRFVLASDTQFSDLTNAPIANFFTVIKRVLVAVDVKDGSGYQVKFSAVDNSEVWTLPEGAGNQEFITGGPVLGATGGDFGVILQENALTRMDFVGGDLRFTFDPVEGAIGCSDAASIIEYKGNTFYLSEEGFQVYDGASSINVSAEKVSEEFFANFDLTRGTQQGDVRVTDAGETRVISRKDVIQAALYPNFSLVAWSYPAGGANKIIMYNYKIDRWSESDVSITGFHTASRKTGQIFAGFNSLYQLVHFDGSQETATMATGDLQLMKGSRTNISCARGLVDAAHTINVSKKTALSDTETIVSGNSNTEGKVSIRANARYHRIELVPNANFTEITGVDLEMMSGAGRAR